MADENNNNYAKARDAMLDFDIKGRGIINTDVINALGAIPREEFIPEPYKSQAYMDGPLPIGYGQTISQPYIVALMTEKLKLDRNCIVLEIGTGSGYQAAILSRLAKKVYTIEKCEELSLSAQAVLKKLGITNVEFLVGDGSLGWPGNLKFDRIILTAATPKIPQTLIDQLEINGIIIAPVGGEYAQQLMLCQKKSDSLIEKTVCDVRFVKLVGKHGFHE